MTFRKGTKVVYPKHGISVVEEVCERQVGEEIKKFYCLRLKTDAKVFIPCENAERSGLRPPLSPKEAKAVFTQIKRNGRSAAKIPSDWKTRFESNLARLESGRADDLVGVLQSLNHVQRRKELSYREKEMYDEVLGLLAEELAMAHSTGHAEMMEQIRVAISGGKASRKNGKA